MNEAISILKGLHPGIVLERELQRRKIPKGRFALSVSEYPQTLGAITKGKRAMNPALALRIEEALGMEEGFFMVLQAYYDMRQEKLRRQSGSKPDLSKLRRVLFWDTDVDKIDWQAQAGGVIRRVFERGNEVEQAEIRRFYGDAVVERAIKAKAKSSRGNG